MKKLCLLLVAFLVMANDAYCESPVQLMFRVVDAAGNADTVKFAEIQGATDGIDAELGEVNLYNVPPNDLDLRIIKRTDTNCINRECGWLGIGTDSVPYWLCPVYGMWCRHHILPNDSNVDQKLDFRNMIPAWQGLALKVYAKHYPVTLTVIHDSTWAGYGHYSHINYAMFSDDGMLFSANNSIHINCQLWKYDEGEDTLFVFNNEDENHITSICLGHGVGIEDDANAVTLYPNPSSDYVMLESESNDVLFSIIDIEGKIIDTFLVDNSPYRLDVSRLKNGIYYIKNNRNIIYKFIKN